MDNTKNNSIEIISLKNKPGLENEVFTVLSDAIYEATIEKARMIILEFCTNNKNDLFGYFESGNLVGIIGIEINEEIEIQEVKEKERFVNPNIEKHPKKWEAEELILLLDSKITENKLVTQFNRSQMSIAMQRAQFIPEFISWAKLKGFEANKITRTIIKQFLEEKKGLNYGRCFIYRLPLG